MDDRRLAEPLVALPPRRLAEREVDLHLRASVAERSPPCARGRRAARCRAASASRCRSPRGPPSACARPPCAHRRSTRARRARRSRTCRPARGCRRRARRRASRRRRAGSACRPPAPRRRSPAPCSRSPPPPGRARCAGPTARARRAPSATRTSARASRAPRSSSCPVKSRAPARPSRRTAFHPSAAPWRDHSSVPRIPKARSAFGKNPSSIGPHSVAELGGVAVGGAQEERALAVRERGRRREVGVQVLEAVPRELVAELRMRRPADPERMPRAEDVVLEPRRGDLGGLDRAAEPVVALEHAHVPAALREQRRAREAVDARADDDRVVVSQRSPGTRRR